MKYDTHTNHPWFTGNGKGFRNWNIFMVFPRGNTYFQIKYGISSGEAKGGGFCAWGLKPPQTMKAGLTSGHFPTEVCWCF